MKMTPLQQVREQLLARKNEELRQVELKQERVEALREALNIIDKALAIEEKERTGSAEKALERMVDMGKEGDRAMESKLNELAEELRAEDILHHAYAGQDGKEP